MKGREVEFADALRVQKHRNVSVYTEVTARTKDGAFPEGPGLQELLDVNYGVGRSLVGENLDQVVYLAEKLGSLPFWQFETVVDKITELCVGEFHVSAYLLFPA
jgi:hypothetical protein